MRVFGISLFAFLLVALLMAPLLSAYGAINMTADPTGSALFVVGTGSQSSTNFSAFAPAYLSNVPAGNYVVYVSKPGYQTYHLSFNVLENKTRSFNFSLSALSYNSSGSLNVYSSPSATALIYRLPLNYQLTNGSTPLALNHVLEAGAYAVTLRQTGYYDYTVQRNVTAGNTATVNATLTSLNGTLRVTSQPNASLTVQNTNNQTVFTGTTPQDISLAPGTYTVSLSKSDYYLYQTQATVNSGQMTQTEAYLQRQYGYLQIYCTPNCTHNEYDSNGQFQHGGYAPERASLPTGSYSVYLSKNGYDTDREEVTVQADQTVTLNVTLQAHVPHGYLEFASYPNSNVTIRYSGNHSLVYADEVQGGGNLWLLATTYDLNFTRAGYYDYDMQATVPEDGSVRAYAEMVPQNGTLDIYSSPVATAAVYNAENQTMEYGTTHYFVSLKPGTYTVLFSEDGYYGRYEYATVSSGQTTVINTTLVAQNGTLTVYSGPNSTATVYNSQNQTMNYGTTPFSMSLLPGTYTVLYYKDGYNGNYTSVTVSSGQTTVAYATLYR